MNPLEWVKMNYGSAVNRLKVRSAVNPCLWAIGTVTPLAIVASSWLHGVGQAAVIVLAFLPVIVGCIMLLWFLVKDPNKLRSETHEQVMELVNLIEHKGGTIVLPNTIEDTSNTHALTVKVDPEK